MTDPISSHFSAPIVVFGKDFIKSVAKMGAKDASLPSNADSHQISADKLISSMQHSIAGNTLGRELDAWSDESLRGEGWSSFFSRQRETIADPSKPLFSKIVAGISFVGVGIGTAYPVTSVLFGIGSIVRDLMGHDTISGNAAYGLFGFPFLISTTLITVGKLFVAPSEKEVQESNTPQFLKEAVKEKLNEKRVYSPGVGTPYFLGTNEDKENLIEDIGRLKNECVAVLGDGVKNCNWYIGLDRVVCKTWGFGHTSVSIAHLGCLGINKGDAP